MKHELPKLPYEYNSLEPYINEETMHIHHDKHHQAYVDKLNAALEAHPQLQDKSVQELITELNTLPQEIKAAVQNNGGGHANHTLFWDILAKDKECEGEIAEAIEDAFGSFEEFKETFTNAALTQFGSGWAWLVINKQGQLEVKKTANQDSPLTQGDIPLLMLDVWEHAYYLKYQNKRPAYVDAFFNIINWEKVNELFVSAR